MKQTIVKRKGHTEDFDNRKIYASAYAACLSVNMHHGEAELVAEKVSVEIEDWLGNKEQVTSKSIFEKVTESLEVLNPDAAFMYKTHRDVS